MFHSPGGTGNAQPGGIVKIVLGGFASALVAAAAIAAILLIGQPPDAAQPPSTSRSSPTRLPSASPPLSLPLSLDEANRLGADIRSNDATRVKAAVTAPPNWTPSKETLTKLAALRFAAVSGTVRKRGDGIASVVYDVTDASGKHARWQATLTLFDTRWKLVLTEVAR